MAACTSVTAAATACSTISTRSDLSRVPGCSKPFGGGDARIRGPFPILSTPYKESGEVDFQTLAEEAKFVDKCGCDGAIWPQSGDSCDLLTLDEKLAGMEAMAKALENSQTVATFGCQGRDFGEAKECAKKVKELSSKYRINAAIISRPPDNGKTEEDLEKYYRAVGNCRLPNNNTDRRRGFV